METSWKFFLALEAMAEVTGLGVKSWKILDTLGRPWVDLPEALRSDLLTWRWLLGIGERIRVNKEKSANG